jgi:hypothetical protein
MDRIVCQIIYNYKGDNFKVKEIKAEPFECEIKEGETIEEIVQRFKKALTKYFNRDVRLRQEVKTDMCCVDCKYKWQISQKDLNCADFCPVLKEEARKFREARKIQNRIEGCCREYFLKTNSYPNTCFLGTDEYREMSMYIEQVFGRPVSNCLAYDGMTIVETKAQNLLLVGFNM